MSLIERLYDKFSDDDDGRLCEDIPESACRETPRSFSLFLVSNFLTKLGDAIASPKTVLAWLVTSVGAPAFILGFLVPLRESGSMIPQLFIGGAIRKLALRKWVWVLGSVAQGLCVIGIGISALVFDGRNAGWSILLLTAAFSLARGFSSVAAKDVIGKTITKPRRGQLNGWAASLAGLLSIGIGVLLMLPSAIASSPALLGLLIAAAGMLWLMAAAAFSQINEFPGETGGGRNALQSLGRLSILVTDKAFRRFVITRALLMCSALSAPFYIALAQKNYGSPTYLLGAFVVAAGAAGLVSAPLWGRFADLSSKSVMIAAALITSGIGLVTFVTDRFLPGITATAWFLPLAYLVLSVAHSGVRIGRKTYVVNLASGNQRTDYVAIGNTT
ncbi:MAG: MFS transporter, partial [Gammaproteobacteria bacterium]|nr:MFS transporter [Gammaproteobacteria bacterium]